MPKISDVPGGAGARRAEILRAIAEEEARLAQLAAQHSDARTKLAALQSELAALGTGPEVRVRPAIVTEVVVKAPLRSRALQPVTWFPSLMGDGQDPQVLALKFVDKIERETTDGHAPDGACSCRPASGNFSRRDSV